MQLARLLALGAAAVSACGQRISAPLEVVVPTQHAQPARLSAAECSNAEEVCGYAFGRECPGVDKNSCAMHCPRSGLQVDGGVFISPQCGDCIWDYGVVCSAARRAADGACKLLRRCEEERRALVPRRP